MGRITGKQKMGIDREMKSNAFENRGRTAKSSPLVDNFVLLYATHCNFNAPVLGTAFVRIVAGNRIGFAVIVHHDAVPINIVVGC